MFFLNQQRERLKKRIEKYVKMLKVLEERDIVLGAREDVLLFKLEKVVPNLHIALQSIDNGAYGICLDCHDKIPKARLLAVPGAVRCKTCQEKKEANNV